MKLKEFFSSPDKWTKGVYARNKLGHSVFCKSSEAVSFCLIGGIMKCYPVKPNMISHLIYKEVGKSADEFNDNPNTTFEDITKLLNKLDI